MEPQQAYRHSDTIGAITAALSKAQGAMRSAEKDATNPFHKSRYATLGSVWEVARKPLADNGLALAQFPHAEGIKVTVVTLLAHGESGEWMEGSLTLMSKEPTPQGVGAAITYARRYSMLAVTGIAPEDDDGEAAEGREPGETKELSRARQADIAQEKIRRMHVQKSKEKALEIDPAADAGKPMMRAADAVKEMDLESRLKASIGQAEAVRVQNETRQKHDNAFGEMVGHFQHLKKKCEEMGRLNIYYDALEAYGVKHSNEFQDFRTAREAYKLLRDMVTDALGMVDADAALEAEQAEAMREQ